MVNKDVTISVKYSSQFFICLCLIFSTQMCRTRILTMTDIDDASDTRIGLARWGLELIKTN